MLWNENQILNCQLQLLSSLYPRSKLTRSMFIIQDVLDGTRELCVTKYWSIGLILTLWILKLHHPYTISYRMIDWNYVYCLQPTKLPIIDSKSWLILSISLGCLVFSYFGILQCSSWPEGYNVTSREWSVNPPWLMACLTFVHLCRGHCTLVPSTLYIFCIRTVSAAGRIDRTSEWFSVRQKWTELVVFLMAPIALPFPNIPWPCYFFCHFLNLTVVPCF